MPEARPAASPVCRSGSGLIGVARSARDRPGPIVRQPGSGSSNQTTLPTALRLVPQRATGASTSASPRPLLVVAFGALQLRQIVVVVAHLDQQLVDPHQPQLHRSYEPPVMALVTSSLTSSSVVSRVPLADPRRPAGRGQARARPTSLGSRAKRPSATSSRRDAVEPGHEQRHVVLAVARGCTRAQDAASQRRPRASAGCDGGGAAGPRGPRRCPGRGPPPGRRCTAPAGRRPARGLAPPRTAPRRPDRRARRAGRAARCGRRRAGQHRRGCGPRWRASARCAIGS